MGELKVRLTSRKFWVWIAWTLITAYTLVRGVPDLSLGEVLRFYGYVSLAYLGVEGGMDILSRKKESGS